MAELVVLNGASNIARSTVRSLLQNNFGMYYKSVKVLDSRPFRQSVYKWQRSLAGVNVDKVMARSAASIDINIEGATDVVYFTHDYFTMASDKNAHLQIASQLCKKHGVENFVAVTPIEHDLAWSEDDESYYQKAVEAEQITLQNNPNATILRTNLTFGPESHLIHFLSQCALTGKCPYKNLIAQNKFNFAPVYTDELAFIVGQALDSTTPGRYSVSGPS